MCRYIRLQTICFKQNVSLVFESQVLCRYIRLQTICFKKLTKARDNLQQYRADIFAYKLSVLSLRNYTCHETFVIRADIFAYKLSVLRYYTPIFFWMFGQCRYIRLQTICFKSPLLNIRNNQYLHLVFRAPFTYSDNSNNKIVNVRAIAYI